MRVICGVPSLGHAHPADVITRWQTQHVAIERGVGVNGSVWIGPTTSGASSMGPLPLVVTPCCGPQTVQQLTIGE